MNVPKVPDNNKDWKEIDIFLFSNGEQYSPPRKYHLESDQLEFWDATINYLARTQYGSSHSYIELYTLNGKKIATPLELIDTASYVAVEPPGSFIPAGYERYLIKASRSWEKRLEKLTNMADMTGDPKIIEGHSKSPFEEFKAIEATTIQNPTVLKEKDLDSIGTNYTIIDGLKNYNAESFVEKPKFYKPFINRKSVDSVKNRIFKKNPTQISKMNKDDSIAMKNRNSSVPKNFKCTVNRRQSLSTKNETKITKPNIFNNPKDKMQPNIPKHQEVIEVKERIVRSKPNSINEYQSNEVSSFEYDRGLLAPSDVYKNPESEVQSEYTDAKIITREFFPRDKYKTHELQKIVELNDKFVNTKAQKSISVQSILCSNKKHGQEISTSISSRAKVFNIKLNIEVRDERGANSLETRGHLGKCKSNTALLTMEQESQADLGVNLYNEDYKYEDSIPKKKSTFSDKLYLNGDVGETKVIVVNCTCGLLDDNNITNKTKENYILFVPSGDKNVESCSCNPDNNEPVDKISVKSHHSILYTDLKSNPGSKENSQAIIKHKVSICPDSPIKFSADIPYDPENRIFSVPFNTIPLKENECTQTKWCNILLQARPQANGHSSFHFPPLGVLAQYNLL